MPKQPDERIIGAMTFDSKDLTETARVNQLQRLNPFSSGRKCSRANQPTSRKSRGSWPQLQKAANTRKPSSGSSNTRTMGSTSRLRVRGFVRNSEGNSGLRASRAISTDAVETKRAHLRVGHAVLRVGRVRAQKDRVLVSQLRVEVGLERDRRAICRNARSDQIREEPVGTNKADLRRLGSSP